MTNGQLLVTSDLFHPSMCNAQVPLTLARRGHRPSVTRAALAQGPWGRVPSASHRFWWLQVSLAGGRVLLVSASVFV